MSFIWFPRWCTWVAQWRCSDPRVSSSEQTALWFSLGCSLLSPCSDITIYCWPDSASHSHWRVSGDSQKEYDQFSGRKSRRTRFFMRVQTAAHSLWHSLSPSDCALLSKSHIRDTDVDVLRSVHASSHHIGVFTALTWRGLMGNNEKTTRHQHINMYVIIFFTSELSLGSCYAPHAGHHRNWRYTD